jgi:beta-galactosidase
MTRTNPPINPRFPVILHGGDYNPDQWLHRPDIIDEDFRLMEKAHINTASIGIFAWASLEPEEGRFDFAWMDDILDRMADRGMAAVLATPTGAKPAWLGVKYPETRRMTPDGHREPWQRRHNHCMTSPIYREKAAIINDKLAERYKDHPALAVWHISNEYGGQCHCDLCKQAFREWLEEKYGTLEALNLAWWSHFWSHTITEWSQIHAIDPSVDCMVLDWWRFTTHQTTDFMLHEIAALRPHTPDVPVTTNFMGAYGGLDYWKMAPHVDVISTDQYPAYHDRPDDWRNVAVRESFIDSMLRSLKGKGFMLMESSPGPTNWMAVSKVKRPGVHRLHALQVVSHGAETVQYFQFRKGRGSHEKYHGAVVDHEGTERTRMFQEVASLGADLEKLSDVVGTVTPADVAIYFDWEARWAMDTSAGLGKGLPRYVETCASHFAPLWRMGIAADAIPSEAELDKYKLVIAPMLYMLKPGVADRLKAYVRGGGTLVATYLTGIVDEFNRALLGGWPGQGLRELFGIWVEEIDQLYPEDEQSIIATDAGKALGLNDAYEAIQYCDRIHAEGAEVLATYGKQFYAGSPAVTINRVGDGQAVYMGSRNDDRFLLDLMRQLAGDLGLTRALDSDLPTGVTAQLRCGDDREFVFLLNFTNRPQTIALDGGDYTRAIDGKKVSQSAELDGYGSLVLERAARS